MILPLSPSSGLTLIGQTIRYIMNLVQQPAIVLLYHRVVELPHDPQLLAVSPKNFYDQINFIKKNYHLLSVEEFHHNLQHKKTFPKKSILITFDDGYADNFYKALPILSQCDAQALFFICTGQIGTLREFWWDDLDRIFLSNSSLPEYCMLRINNQKYQFDSSPQNRKTTYQKLHQLLKIQNFSIRENVLKKLYQWSGLDENGRERNRIMTEAEILQLSQSKHAVIGAHTNTHCALSSLSYNEQLNDIQESKKRLEEIIGQPVEYFSYPFGAKADYDTNSLKIVKKINFKLAMSNYYWQVHPWTDRYQIPRILVRDWDLKTFKQKINQFFHY